MPRPLTDEDVAERAAIDGRVAFAIAAFVGLTALIALLDRIGAPETALRVLGPLVALGALAAAGVLLRSMRVSRFYAAGRATPTPYVGFAMAALLAGFWLPFAPPAASSPVDLRIAIGAAAGCAFATLAVGPYLRKTGAFSLSDLVASRFPNPALRLGLATTIAACGGLVGLAGYETAVSTLADALGFERPIGAAAVAFALVLTAAPGGLSGVVWTANGAGGLLLAGLALPIVALLKRGEMPTPGLDDPIVWNAAAYQLKLWQAGATLSTPGAMVAACGAACGFAALAPLLAPAVAARDGAAALRAGALALFWAVCATLVVGMGILWGAVVFSRASIGQMPDRLPEAIYAASAAGAAEICGGRPTTPADARRQCEGRITALGLTAEDVKPLGPLYLLALAGGVGAGATGASLFAAAMLAIGLAMATAGFHVCATALGHDLFYRVRDSAAQTSRRLAVTRALLVLVVALGAVVAGARDDDPRMLLALAMALSASAALPLVVLSLSPRAGGPDAVVALLAGLAGAEVVLFSSGPSWPALAQASLAGAATGIAAGFASTLRPRDVDPRGRAFVDAVLHRDGDVFAPDKGA